jgi:protoheme IX farnesyltransferase
VFSSFISYFLGSESINFIDLTYLLTGGILIVSSSNIFNQIIERDLDKLMNRTKNRPLPKNKIKINTALLLAITTGVLGIVLMYLINIKVAILAAASIFIYTAIYTPMKLVSPLAVFVGAIPWRISFYDWLGSRNKSNWNRGNYIIFNAVFLAIPTFLVHRLVTK